MSLPKIYQRGQVGNAPYNQGGDADEYLQAGTWYFYSGVVPTNWPSGLGTSAGFLVVKREDHATNYRVIQYAIRHGVSAVSAGITYVRSLWYTYNTKDSGKTEWTRVDSISLTQNVTGLTEDLELLMDDVADHEVRVTALEAGGGSGTVAIGSQTQAGILRLASDQRLTLENDTEPARADQVASLYSRTSLVEARVTTLEASGGTGTGDITINPTGGLESAANGVGIKLTASTTTAATSGLTTTASGTSVSLPYNIGAVAASSYAGRVQPLAASYFTRNRADVSTTYLVPHANAHQALVNRVFALEDSVGDVATALAAILRS